MSVKVPHGSTEYQSHHRCKCDFCDSRRCVDAKKNGVSRVIGRSLAPGAATPSFELDDPEHHVNQTELNAKMGRIGLPNGDKYTIATGGTRGLQGRHPVGAHLARSVEEKEAEVTKDLDRLERLLILEHKARAKAVADADKLALLQSTGKGPRPQPFDPTADVAGALGGAGEQDLADEEMERRRGVSMRLDSVTPPPHCDASHLLQHTMDNVREVTRDPANRGNAAALRSILHKQGVPGVTPPPPPPQGTPFPKEQATKDAAQSRMENLWNYFGPRPEGAGVVWRKVPPCMPEDFSTGCGGLGNIDNRDAWKRTLLRGNDTLKQTTVKANAVDQVSVSTASGALNAGAAAASLSGQKRQGSSPHEANSVEAPQILQIDTKSDVA